LNQKNKTLENEFDEIVKFLDKIHLYIRVGRKRGVFANPNGHAIVIKYGPFKEFLHLN
jgi:hypothetical protein